MNFARCVGEVTGVHVRHDNTGDHPDWLLHEIMVEDLHHDTTYHCEGDIWISEEKGLNRLLKCHNTATEEPPGWCLLLQSISFSYFLSSKAACDIMVLTLRICDPSNDHQLKWWLFRFKCSQVANDVCHSLQYYLPR